MNAAEMFSLGGKVALVTGASRGIGLAMARALGQAGARVVLNGRERATLEQAAQALDGEGIAASVAPFDVADERAAAAAIEELAADHGRLDILVNNAGVNHVRPLGEFATEEWRRVIDTNLTACFVLSREAAKAMIAGGSGRILVTASIMTYLARPGIFAYVAAKSGLGGLVRALAVELGSHGITCNAIAPGYIRTEMTARLEADAAFDAKIRARTPAGRWGEVDDLTGATVFLASDAAAYVNGQVLVVDGGLTVAL